MQEVLVLLRGSGTDETDQTIKAITRLNGRAVHIYPRVAIVALLPEGMISTIAREASVESVHVCEVTEELMGRAQRDVRAAMSAWNQHLLKKQTEAQDTMATQGLSWDHPGMLPPDPPAEIREMLSRRERQLLEPEDPGMESPK